MGGSATGVYVGVSTHDYGLITTTDLGEMDVWTATGAAGSIIANRLSYLLDLRGPSMALDSACSSSLLAVHQAVRSLRSGEVDAALAGGVNMVLAPTITVVFDQGGALAPDGRCKAFDASADGIARGEGAGVVVLKRLSDAERDGDEVLAVIAGSAVNSDGRSNGLMAPNPAAQADLLRLAYRDAGVHPNQVDYVEAHGTGTLLGQDELRPPGSGGRHHRPDQGRTGHAARCAAAEPAFPDAQSAHPVRGCPPGSSHRTA